MMTRVTRVSGPAVRRAPHCHVVLHLRRHRNAGEFKGHRWNPGEFLSAVIGMR